MAWWVGSRRSLQVWGICLAQLKAAVVLMPFYPPELPCRRHQCRSEKETKFTTGWFRGFFFTFVFVAHVLMCGFCYRASTRDVLISHGRIVFGFI